MAAANTAMSTYGATQSLQDTSIYDSEQTSAGGQVTFGYGFSAEANYANSNIKSNYASVNEQSGILAGDGGYTIHVNNHTDLKGAIITSSQSAEENTKNSFTTATLSSEDITNYASYKGESIGLEVKGGYSNSNAPTNGNLYNPTSTSITQAIGYGEDKESQSSTTHNGINTTNITILDQANSNTTPTDIHTTTTTAQVQANNSALKNNFDADAVQSELDIQVEVTKSFSETRQEVSIIIDTKIRDLQDEASKAALAGDLGKAEELKNLVDNWKQGGLIVDGIANALYAPNNNGTLGTIAEVASPELVAIVGDYFKETNQENTTQHIVAQSLLGAAITAATGNDALMGAVSSGGSVVLAPIVANWLYNDAKDLTAEQQATIGNIISLAMSSLDAATSLNTNSVVNTNLQSQNVVNNNVLETGWDIVNVIYDVGKISVGYVIGDKVLTKEGWIDLAVDSAAVLIPFVPAGITKIDDVVGGGRGLKNVFSSLKNSPDFPQGFTGIQNGTTFHGINNKTLLDELKKIDSGNWKKVYKDGFDAHGNAVSVHYFQSQSGKVFNVKVKNGHSN